MTKWTKEHFLALQRQFLGDDVTSKDRKRARILKAATELFIAQGYRKTSVDEIAQRAEVAKGTVYLHFENKADLLMHAVALEKQVLFTKLAPLLEGQLPEEERLHFYVRSLLTIARDLPLVARLLGGDNELMIALEERNPALLAIGQQLGESWLAELIDQAAPAEHDAAALPERANVPLSLRWLLGLLLDEPVRGGRSLDAFAATMADVLVHGLVHRPPEDDDEDDEDAGDEDEAE